MIAHLAAKLTPSSEFNRTLKIVTRSAWIASGALFVCYLYLVGSITFSIVKQREIEQDIKMAVSNMSREELGYLMTQKELTKSAAAELGLVAPEKVSFAPVVRAFAFNNVGR